MSRTTYPRYLGSIPLDLCNTRKQRDLIRDINVLSGIDSEDMHHLDPVRDAMWQVCKRAGYSFSRTKPAPYPLYDYTIGAGSAFTHTDPGMGLTAAAFVASIRLSPPLDNSDGANDICQLITGNRTLDVGISNVFVFNADKPHAWLANCRWALAVQHLSPRRCFAKPPR